MEVQRKELDRLLSVTRNQNKCNKQLIFNHYFSNMITLPPDKTVKHNSCAHRPDRVQIVKEFFRCVPLDPNIRRRYEKNSENSTALRNFGNSAFKAKRWVDAVRWYNLAILFAQSGQPELGLAYANRSSCLNYMGLPEQALRDVDLALANGYPKEPDMQKKLEIKKATFENVLQARRVNSNKVFEKRLKDKLSTMNQFYNELFSIKSPNPLAPALEDSVDVKYNAERGRHLVANRDIPFGTTVLVERPFVSVLLEALNWDVDHCHNCFKKNFQCIPCPNCVFTMYCNDKCLQKAQEYHQYMCPCLPEMHCNLKDYVGGNIQLAFKLICVLGPQKLFEMYKKKKEDTCDWQAESSTRIAGSNPETGVYESNSYRAIYNLCTVINEKEVQQYILYALILSRALSSNTNFFDVIDDEAEKEGFKDFIAELITHHFETFRRNGFGMGEIEHMDGVTLRAVMKPDPKIEVNYGLNKVASGVFCTASLINHSCDQNVMRFTGNAFGTMSFVALKPLKKGQELLTSYSAEYGTLNKLEESTVARRELLNRIYGFECDCIACVNDWPGIDELATYEPIFCCPTCTSGFPHERKMSKEFLKFRLSKDFSCPQCKVTQNEERTREEFEHHRTQLQICHDLVETTSPLDAISKLKTALQFFESKVCPPNYSSIIFGPVIYRDAIHQIIFFADHEKQ